MPFDGTTQGLSAADALLKLVRFFENGRNWYQEDYCRRRGPHSYADGRMCLSGAIEHALAEGASADIRIYVKLAIVRRFNRSGCLEAFNDRATHRQLMTVLRDARAMALLGTAPQLTAPPPPERQSCMPPVEVRPPPVTAPEKKSYVPRVEPRPTPENAPVEVLLLNDLISVFENYQTTGRLSQFIHRLRAAHGASGDKTMTYLRRAIRRVPWTFGSVRKFDEQASREEMLAALRFARHLAIADASKGAPVVEREPLKIAA